MSAPYLISKAIDPVFAMGVGIAAAAVRINREEKEKGHSTQETLNTFKRRTSKLFEKDSGSEGKPVPWCILEELAVAVRNVHPWSGRNGAPSPSSAWSRGGKGVPPWPASSDIAELVLRTLARVNAHISRADRAQSAVYEP
ncbi:hypothetical protein LTR85_006533 [Meristemomyces frigidus]|nr:hypothetical protein LTR85_006533 [Meristemomyces frigidus]